MTTTLSDLRRLLEGGLTRGGPAIDRLSERTVEAMARAYFPGLLSLQAARRFTLDAGDALRGAGIYAVMAGYQLDLTGIGSPHALLVGLALYFGHDPGEGALGVMWYPSAEGWCLGFLGSDHCYKSAVFHGIDGLDRFQDWHYAPMVAAEPHSVKALALAVAHVLETP